MDTESGSIISLQVCPGHREPMRPVDPAVFIADHGLEDDRHARPGSRRQVLLIEAETLDDLDLEPGQVKENVTTRGIDLMGLARGTRLGLADEVELWLTRDCAPCKRMEEIRTGLEDALRGRRGVLAWVEHGGIVRVGARIRVLGTAPRSFVEGT